MIIALKLTCTKERVLNKNDIVFIIRLIQHLMVAMFHLFVCTMFIQYYILVECFMNLWVHVLLKIPCVSLYRQTSVKLSYYTECCAFQIRDNGNGQKG